MTQISDQPFTDESSKMSIVFFFIVKCNTSLCLYRKIFW